MTKQRKERVHVPQETLDALRSVNGVRKVWTFRGRVHLILARDVRTYQTVNSVFAGGFFPAENFGDAWHVVSKWIHPVAESRQMDAALRKETLPLEAAFRDRLNHLLLQDFSMSAEELQADELHDVVPDEAADFYASSRDDNPLTNGGEEILCKYDYKEDFDLERGQKTEEYLRRLNQKKLEWFWDKYRQYGMPRTPVQVEQVLDEQGRSLHKPVKVIGFSPCKPPAQKTLV